MGVGDLSLGITQDTAETASGGRENRPVPRSQSADLIGEDLLPQLSSIPGQPVELPLQQTQAGMR